MTRYSVHTDQFESSFYAFDDVAGRVARDQADSPLVFSSFEDADWYVHQLNNLRTPAEIAAGI